MFRSFFTTIFRGSSAVLCAVTTPPTDLRSLSSYYYAVCGRMCVSSVHVWCSCLLVICLPSRSPTDKNTKHAQITYTCGHIPRNNTACQADHQQTRTPNMHRLHTHAATYRVIIRTQRTQISGRNSNGTKHSGGPPEDGREKRPKHVVVLYLQTRF